VQAGIAPLEAMKLSPPHRVDPRAYDAYMKGRGYWSRGRSNGKPGDMDKSLEQFRLAFSTTQTTRPLTLAWQIITDLRLEPET
jgi:hypothetical protein